MHVIVNDNIHVIVNIHVNIHVMSCVVSDFENAGVFNHFFFLWAYGMVKARMSLSLPSAPVR